ncbi:hypothetical protein L9F63_018362, partial [Diploptera punctata]
DQATEVILTLGQAFEVAYQMALRDQFSGSRGSGVGHMRSQSATHIMAPPSVSLSGTNSSGQQINHSRSLSVNEIKVNGQASGVEVDEEQLYPGPLNGFTFTGRAARSSSALSINRWPYMGRRRFVYSINRRKVEQNQLRTAIPASVREIIIGVDEVKSQNFAPVL